MFAARCCSLCTPPSAVRAVSNPPQLRRCIAGTFSLTSCPKSQSRQQKDLARSSHRIDLRVLQRADRSSSTDSAPKNGGQKGELRIGRSISCRCESGADRRARRCNGRRQKRPFRQKVWNNGQYANCTGTIGIRCRRTGYGVLGKLQFVDTVCSENCSARTA